MATEQVQVIVGPDDLLEVVTEDILITKGEAISEASEHKGDISFSSESPQLVIYMYVMLTKSKDVSCALNKSKSSKFVGKRVI